MGAEGACAQLVTVSGVTTGFSALQGFFRKGKVLLELGQRAEALLAWEHCLTLSPHFHPARREMEKVRGPYRGSIHMMALSSEGLASIMVMLLWPALGLREVLSWSKSLPVTPIQVHPCRKLPFLSICL